MQKCICNAYTKWKLILGESERARQLYKVVLARTHSVHSSLLSHLWWLWESESFEQPLRMCVCVEAFFACIPMDDDHRWIYVTHFPARLFHWAATVWSVVLRLGWIVCFQFGMGGCSLSFHRNGRQIKNYEDFTCNNVSIVKNLVYLKM